jgi:hypothetical protein
MTLTHFFLRFAVSYLVLIIFSFALAKVVGMDSFAVINAISLFAAVNLSSSAFGAQNGHLFNAQQFWPVAAALFAISLCYQGVMILFSQSLFGVEFKADSQLWLSGVVLVAHAIIVFFGLRVSKTTLLKNGQIKP